MTVARFPWERKSNSQRVNNNKKYKQKKTKKKQTANILQRRHRWTLEFWFILFCDKCWLLPSDSSEPVMAFQEPLIPGAGKMMNDNYWYRYRFTSWILATFFFFFSNQGRLVWRAASGNSCSSYFLPKMSSETHFTGYFGNIREFQNDLPCLKSVITRPTRGVHPIKCSHVTKTGGLFWSHKALLSS